MRTALAPSAAPSLWQLIAERASLGSYVPVLRQDLTWARMKTRHGKPNVMLADRPRRYIRIGERDDFLIQRMDGTRRVSDLVVDYFERFGVFGFEAVSNIVTLLRNAGFLADPPRDVWKASYERLHPESADRGPTWWEGTPSRLKIPIRGLDGFFTRYHDTVGWFFFTPPFLVLTVILSLAGFIAFLAEVVKGRDPFAPIAGSGLAAIVALVVSYYVVIAIHESAHALTCKHFGRLVPKGGFLLYYLMPAFYVDVTDAWLEPWRRRIAIFWAGPYSGFTIAGAAALAVWVLPHGVVAEVLFKLAVAAYLTNALNLMPLMLLDGYWILEQWLEIPQLRDRALDFVRGPFWNKIWQRQRLSRRELFFAVFGALSAVYTVFAAVFAIYLWRRRLTPLLLPLWRTPGLLPKAIVTVVILAVSVPLGIRYGRRFWKALHGLARLPNVVRRAIHTVRMSDRIRLLSSLAFLRGLPHATVERLAQAAHTRLVAAGEVVVRQGERGAEFFIIASGNAEVSVVARGEEHVVRELKPGDFFGERALLEHGPRTATVRALTPMRLLAFGEATFWNELAGPIAWRTRVRESLQEREMLARVPLFADMTSRKLDLLAVKLEVIEVPAGKAVVRKGEIGRDFYIVRGGTFVAVDGRRKLREMRTGDFFGEIALLRDTPRTATVSAPGGGTVWRLARQDFEELLGRYLELEDEFEKVATVRGHGMQGAA